MKATTFFLQVLPTGHVLRVTSYPVLCIEHLYLLWGAVLFDVTYTSWFYMFQLHWSTYKDGQKETIPNVRRLLSSNHEDCPSTMCKTSTLWMPPVFLQRRWAWKWSRWSQCPHQTAGLPNLNQVLTINFVLQGITVVYLTISFPTINF